MDLGSIFLIFSLFILVGLFVARPFFEGQRLLVGVHDTGEHERSSLLAERDHILDALQELDFDHVLGKIPEEDYPTQRAALLHRGAEVLRKLDEISNQTGAHSVEDRLEEAIAARRADSARGRESSASQTLAPASQGGQKTPASTGSIKAAASDADDNLEVILANRKRARPDKAAGFCPQCGSPLQVSDRFCPKCGKKI